MRVRNSGFPVATFTESETRSTEAAFPLSQIAAIVPVLSISPSGGISPNSSKPCPPCSISAGLKVPSLSKGMPPPPSTTAMVGRTRCGASFVFSVVKASSSRPAPTPSA